MIQRIFHPVGQGAFYSERHDEYNIIYDCGNWKNTKLSDKVVKQAFSESDEIDLLFISHFDFDHVSKIPTLKKHVRKIRNVILPLLHQDEKIILSNFYRILGFDILTLINDPKSYFDSDTRLIFVSPQDNQDEVINEAINPQIINNLTFGERGFIEIKSGSALSLNSEDIWVFVPYNYEFKHRNIQLIAELKKEGFDDSKIKFDSNYCLETIERDLKLPKKQGGKKFQAIYNRLSGKINQNSMVLYSGPLKNDGYRKFCQHKNSLGLLPLDEVFDRVGCLYTGDTDLNKINIQHNLGFLWKNVGTIQIPHHGDIKSFDESILKGGPFCCPISFGTNNSYGHPSPAIIGKIKTKQSFPVCVTEKLDSFHIEIIDKISVLTSPQTK